MADENEKVLAQIADLQGKLDLFVDEMTWKKGRTDEDVYHGALCSGILALTLQNNLILQLLQGRGDGIGSVPTRTPTAAEPIEDLLSAKATGTDFSTADLALAEPVQNEDNIPEAEPIDDEDIPEAEPVSEEEPEQG